MREPKPHVLIFSVALASLSDAENTARHEAVLRTLHDSLIPFTVVEGCYQGSKELSYVLPAQYRDEVEAWCKEYNQEAYLDSDNERSTHLVYRDGIRKHVGTMVPVSKTEALISGNYTYSPATETYYATK